MGAKDATQEADKAGAFVRTDATFRDHISKGGKYEPEGERVLPVFRRMHRHTLSWARHCSKPPADGGTACKTYSAVT